MAGKAAEGSAFPGAAIRPDRGFHAGAAGAHKSIPGDCLEFTILTAARYNESTGARVGEIDFTKAEWRVPADRMKMTMPHVVPLSARALAIAQSTRKGRAPMRCCFPTRMAGN